ncbi:MAG: hypothetical protein M1834_005052 [Cirrosporium novae-zelandiae]|nr:MAG: hypothetical protein M1834_005052 [Cirrosporium novae-zelandiae]
MGENNVESGQVAPRPPKLVSIAELSPSLPEVETLAIKATVTLVWPYSSSQRSITLRIAEPDVRLRRDKGQVRVKFIGPSGKELSKTGITNGDRVTLYLVGVEWKQEGSTIKTPGKEVDWVLQFSERTKLEITRDVGLGVSIDIDHPPASPQALSESTSPFFSPTRSPVRENSSVFQFPTDEGSYIYSSPAFLKRSRISLGSLFGSQVDPFAENVDYLDGRPHKKARLSWGSSQWGYSGQEQSTNTESNKANEAPRSSRSPPLTQADGQALDTLMVNVAVEAQLDTVSPPDLAENDREVETREYSPVLDQDVEGDSSANSKTAPEKPSSVANKEMDVDNSSTPTGMETFSQLAQGGSDLLEHDLRSASEPLFIQQSIGINGFAISPLPQHPSSVTLGVFESPRLNPLDSSNLPLISPLVQRKPPADYLLASDQGQENESELDMSGYIQEQGQDDPSAGASGINSTLQKGDFTPHDQLKDPAASAHALSAHKFDTEVQITSLDQDSTINIKLTDENLAMEALAHIGAGQSYAATSHPIENVTLEMPESGGVSFREELDSSVSSQEDDSDLEIVEREEIHEDSDEDESNTYLDYPFDDEVSDDEATDGDDDESNAVYSEQHDIYDKQSVEDIDESDEAEVSGEEIQPSYGTNIHNLSGDEINEDLSESSEESDEELEENIAIQEKVPQQRSSGIIDLEPDSEEGESLDTDSEGLEEDDEEGLENDYAGDEIDNKALSSKYVVESENGSDSGASQEQAIQDSKTEPNAEMLDEQSAEKLEDNVESEGSRQGVMEDRGGESTQEGLSKEIIMDDHKLRSDKSLDLVIGSHEESEQRTNLEIEESLELKSTYQGDQQREEKNQQTIGTTSNLITEVHYPSRLEDSPGKQLETLRQGDNRDLEIDLSDQVLVDPRFKNSIATPELSQQNQPEELQIGGLVPQLQPQDLLTPQLTQSFTQISQTVIAETTQELTSLVNDIEYPQDPDMENNVPKGISAWFVPKQQNQQNQKENESEDKDQVSVKEDQMAMEEDQVSVEANEPEDIGAWFIPKRQIQVNQEASESENEDQVSMKQNEPEGINTWFVPKRQSQQNREESESEGEGQISAEDDEDQSEHESKVTKPSDQEAQDEDSLITPFKQDSNLPDNKAAWPLEVKQQSPSPGPDLTGFRTRYAYFTNLSALGEHFSSKVDVLAILVNSTELIRSKSGPKDYTITLLLTVPAHSPNVTIAQIFRPRKEALPSVKKGDAILLRDFKVQSLDHEIALISTESSAWAVFSPGSKLRVDGPPLEFGAEERSFATGLRKWWDKAGNTMFEKYENNSDTQQAREGTASTQESELATTEGGEDSSFDMDGSGRHEDRKHHGKNHRRRKSNRIYVHELRNGTRYPADSSPRGETPKKHSRPSIHKLRDGRRYAG